MLVKNGRWTEINPQKLAWAQSFATVREMWAFYGTSDTTSRWSFLEKCADSIAFKASQAQIPCNQRVTWLNGQVEQVSVGSAYQHYLMSRTVPGPTDPETSVPKFDGWTLRKQFDRLRAYATAPIATIAGWNEWIVSRGVCNDDWPVTECSGDHFPTNNNKIFTDSYDYDYNRDLECDSTDCRYLGLMRELVLNFKGGWLQGPGAALDIGAGGGQIWITGTDTKIYVFNGTNWTNVPGFATRIDVGPDGKPWVINSVGEIYRRIDTPQGPTWQAVVAPPGTVALDIGIGANGSVWVTGANQNIYMWSGLGWALLPGGATRIDVAPDGNPWVVNASGGIFRLIAGNWQPVGGLVASDIGIGANGAVYATGSEAPYVDNVVHRFTGSGWEYVAGAGSRISVTGDGVPLLVTSSGTIYYRP